MCKIASILFAGLFAVLIQTTYLVNAQTRDATTQESTGNTNTNNAKASASVAAVNAAFEKLLDGVRRADVEKVMSVYLKSPSLVLFNNNGTVTKSWDQVRANRQSSYPKLKDVKLDVRDINTQLISANSALITCLWTQSQTVDGVAERSTGRLTLVFKRVGGEWKIIHTHTSPDAPDPSRLTPSEKPGQTN